MINEKGEQKCPECGWYNGRITPEYKSGEVNRCRKCKSRYQQVSASIVNTTSGRINVKKISISARVDKKF